MQSKKARRTREASKGIVAGSYHSFPPELARLRQSSLYMGLPSSICREQLDGSIEDQIVDGNEDEDLKLAEK